MTEDISEMASIEKQIKSIKNNLLDLTMRNRLLNFVPKGPKTVKIIKGDPKDIYNTLVMQEKRIELSSNKNEFGGLQTELDVDVLNRRLKAIGRDAKSALEEQGFTILYLALGFLEWTESPDSVQPKLAPLILVPIELEHTKFDISFKISWTEEDLFTNISLKEKLLEQSIVLPDFEMKDSESCANIYLEQVNKAVSSMPKWKVLNDIYLGFFSFTKFVMYKDLDTTSLATCPLTKAIFNPSSVTQSISEFSEGDVDEKLKSCDLYHVMDADPSQIAVVEDVKAGKDLVVEGPPGTGKSQTITNIIAEFLAQGKTVLFVSEKMAALDVVKSRLDNVGLGDFCLELHSRKSNKKEVLKELERTLLKSSSVSNSQSITDKDYNKLDDIKRELNDYAKALREPLKNIGWSPFSLFCIKEDVTRHFAKYNRSMIPTKFSNIEKYKQVEYDIAISALQGMTAILPLVRPIKNNPWRGCYPTMVLPSDENEIDILISECKNSITEIEVAIEKLTSMYGIRRPNNLKEMPNIISAARLIAVSIPIDKNILTSPEWNQPRERTKLSIQNVEKIQKQSPIIKSKFNEDALDKDINSLYRKYKELSTRSFLSRIFGNKRYNDIKREIFSIYNGIPNESNIIVDLQELIAFKNLRKEIQESDQLCRLLFGSYWKGDKSDPQTLHALSEWIVSFRQELSKKTFNEHTIDVICGGTQCGQIETVINDINNVTTRFKEKRDLLTHIVNANYQEIFGVHIDDVTFNSYMSHIELWKAGLSNLRNWSQFNNVRKTCLDTIANPTINMIDSDMIEPDDIIDCFNGNFADALLKCAFTERPTLANFAGDLHDKKIKSFVDLDKELIKQNRQRLINKLYQSQPHITGGASKNSEVGTLLGEFNRKRGHMPIRKLMFYTGRLIQKIKPCFMMSPLSIAQFLDPNVIRFDLIVFDEASQVKPEDALGALLRGNQVVVIGDTKQMPPTSFFDNIAGSDDEEEEVTAPISDTESILRLCKIHFPSKMLRWHYRSRHDSLIAVSNHQFYDNRLVIYPSAINSAENVGLKLIHLPNTVYDRGKSSVNRIEAKAVAKAAFEHYMKRPDKSLGIGTFNIKQQRAIEDEIDLLIRDNPDIGEYFNPKRNEYCFVKNLETIQGDERDVIFISVGFGFDENKHLSLNFGPLNKDGGERRLNVLITRAREQCVVFSNFKAADLRLEPSSPFGLRSLKVFLDFAENRNLNIMESKREDTDSPFEDSVKEFLADHGYDIHSQVGCAGYRIDLAIVSPKSPGRYVLGIECDGARYHSSQVARDRDRLRQQVLEGLGWKLYRVWSTDWYRNRAYTQKRLLDVVERRLLEVTEETKKNDPNVDNKPPLIQPSKDNEHKNGTTEHNYIQLFSEEDMKGKSGTTQPTKNDDHKNGTVQLFSEDDMKSKGRSINIQIIKDDEEDIVERSVESSSFDQIVPKYETCKSLEVYNQDIDKVPAERLASAVVNIVEIEGPVHIDEIVQRIRSYQGLKRSGNKIYDAVVRAANLAEYNDYIVKRGSFYWTQNCHVAKIRRRCDYSPAKIELICDEELTEAVKLVLKHQFATMPEDLVIQSSRILGFRSTSDDTSHRIKSVIENLYSQRELKILPNGMIDLKSQGDLENGSTIKNIFNLQPKTIERILDHNSEEIKKYSQAIIPHMAWIKEEIRKSPDRKIRIKVKDMVKALGIIDQSDDSIYHELKLVLIKESIIVDTGQHKSGEKILILGQN